MAAYFTSDQHLDYLDATTRARSDIDLLTRRAEKIVINHYRRRTPDRRFMADSGSRDYVTGLENITTDSDAITVYLLHYKRDADEVGTTQDEVDFLDAMRLEIAKVVRWLALQEDRSDRGIKSESRGRRSVTYTDDSRQSFPPDFGSDLSAFDTRPAPFVI